MGDSMIYNEPLRKIQTKEANELAEFLLFRGELANSMRALQIYERLRFGRSTEEDSFVAASLFRDAIVQFTGCFGKTEPKLQSATVYAQFPGASDFFRWVQDLRDAYAAHNFGPMRQSVVGMAKQGDGYARGEFVSVYGGPDQSGIHQLKRFVQIAQNTVDRRISVLDAIVSDQVKAMTPDQYDELPIAEFVAAGPGEVRMTRERFASRHRKFAGED